VNELVARVARLERSCRRWRLMSAGLVVLVAAVAAAPKPDPGTIRCHKLYLEDENNKVRAMLTTTPEGATALNFMNKGFISLRLAEDDEGDPSITLWSRGKAKPVLRAALDLDGTGASLRLFDDGGEPIFEARKP
jgi:hypothetical protein